MSIEAKDKKLRNIEIEENVGIKNKSYLEIKKHDTTLKYHNK